MTYTPDQKEYCEAMQQAYYNGAMEYEELCAIRESVMSFKTQERLFRKAAIAQAIEDGYLDTAHDARSYDLGDDGYFHLSVANSYWFRVNVRFDDFGPH